MPLRPFSKQVAGSSKHLRFVPRSRRSAPTRQPTSAAGGSPVCAELRRRGSRGEGPISGERLRTPTLLRELPVVSTMAAGVALQRGWRWSASHAACKRLLQRDGCMCGKRVEWAVVMGGCQSYVST